MIAKAGRPGRQLLVRITVRAEGHASHVDTDFLVYALSVRGPERPHRARNSTRDANRNSGTTIA